MLRRSRLPFWSTILTTLALACVRQGDPASVGLEATGSNEQPEVEEAETATVADAPVEALAGAERQPVGATGIRDEAVARTEPTATPTYRPTREKAEDMGGALSSSPMAKAAPVGSIAPSGPPVTVTGRGGAMGYAPPPPPTRLDLPATGNTEGYTDYGVNDFVAVAEDPLSTFAIDVDTASYTVSRRKLREGYLPPQSAVRVEEFVNYLPYEYRQPASGDPFAVDFEAAPSPWNPRNTIVRVGVQGKKVSMDERADAHLTFLVDVSGSMRSPDKIELLKKSLTMLTEELEDGDTVAIATYAGSTDIVLEPTPISRKADILRALDRLTAGGSTAMASGIDLAYRLADQTYVGGGINRVIICSDGDANVGQTSHEMLSKQIRQYAEKGITLTTLGFGNGNYKDTMMEQLANDGDGNYFYIDTEMEARRVLVDKMTSTLEVIAKDVKIQVDWDPGAVIAYRLIGYENRDVADVDFRNDKVDAGEIGAGHQVTAIYEVALKDDPRGTIATVRVRNKAPGPDAPATERAFSLDASAIRDASDESSDQFRMAFASATFAEILRGSPHVAEVTLRDVEALARGAQRPEYREDAELVDLIGRAATLRGETATYSLR